jgi:CheY-like chemotaxis protein
MATPHDAVPTPAARADGRAPTVLYVEDHPVNVLLMQAIFARRPRVRLEVATSGEAGWAAAHLNRPDLLLLDLHLPDCHGADLLLRLRADPALADVPAVAVTADVAADTTGAGFDEVWQKPVDVQATLARLDALLASEGNTREAGTAVAASGGRPHAAARSRPPSAPIPFSSLAED